MARESIVFVRDLDKPNIILTWPAASVTLDEEGNVVASEGIIWLTKEPNNG